MPQEIERKFLVTTEEYKALSIKSMHITQAYLCKEAKRTIRIRIQDNTGYITIKGKSTANGLSRYEWEKEIPLSEAKELLKLCEGGNIEKIRHLVPCQNFTLEIDEFLGRNQGLILAEVELPTVNTPFSPPGFLSTEVSGQKQYYNSYLSTHPFQEWGED